MGPHPDCPVCGLGLDVIVLSPAHSTTVAYGHVHDGCDRIWGREADQPNNPLTLLGTIADYDDAYFTKGLKRSTIRLDTGLRAHDTRER